MSEKKTTLKQKNTKPVKMIFNVELGRLAEYTLEVDGNNEILARCLDNNDFLKFPNVSEAEVDALIEAHDAESMTQVKKQPLFGAK